MRLLLSLAMVMCITSSCFAWNDKNDGYGMMNPESTTQKIIWVAGSLTLCGLGWNTMVQNAREDNASVITGTIVAYTGVFGLRVALFRW